MATKDHNSPADQRRMVQAITHSFPSNAWRSRISKGKESDRCDLCVKSLWVSQNHFTTESVLHEQTLVHLQHTCEDLRDFHTMTHHRRWCLIHGELSRLVSSTWKFICIEKEKNLRTIWTELVQEFPEVFNLYSTQSLWVTVEKREMDRLLTENEEKMITDGVSRADIPRGRCGTDDQTE